MLLLIWLVLLCRAAHAVLYCRYEELQRQLVDAQAAAEIEEDAAELARAAAAVARLVAPEGSPAVSPVNAGSGPGSNGSRAASGVGTAQLTALESDDEGAGPAAAKLRLLEQELEEARQEVHAAPEDDAPSTGPIMRH